MDIRPIRNQDDYERALRRIEEFFNAAPGTAESEILDILVLLVEAYEKQAFPIPLPDPIEAIEFKMEALGLEPRDLEPYIGSRARVWEVLNRRRPLTLRMIRSLEKGLGISAEVLVQDYDLSNHISTHHDSSAWPSWLADSVNLYDRFSDQMQTPLLTFSIKMFQQHPDEDQCYWRFLTASMISSTSEDSIGEIAETMSEKSNSLVYRISDIREGHTARERCPEWCWTTDSLDVHNQEEVAV